MAVLPILLFIGLLIWQLFIGGHAIIVAANAAREGARVLATCGASSGAAIQQARNAAREFDVVSVDARNASCGGQVEVTVKVNVPSVVGQWVGGGVGSFPIQARTRMRKEWCKGYC
jgi:hypothetical protein